MKLAIPLVLVVSTLAGCVEEQKCEPELVPDAAIPTYRCRDGRTCGAPRPDLADGGIYQICPGPNGCATLIVNGDAQVGFC